MLERRRPTTAERYVAGHCTGANPTSDRVSLSAAWELDVWGKIRRQVESQKASAIASESDLANALLSAQAMLVTSYLQLRATDIDLDLYEHSIVSYERALTITQNRYDAGVAQRTDVTQAQSQLESARAAAFDLAVTRHTLEHAIAVLVGRPPSELTIERTNALPDVPESPAIVPAALLERRPDIAAAERRTAAANAQIGVARAAYFPDLTLTGTGGYESSEFSTLFRAPTASGPSAPTWPKPFSTQAPSTPRSNKTSPPTIST